MTLRGIITVIFVTLVVIAGGAATGVFIQKSGTPKTPVTISEDPSAKSIETALFPPPPNTHSFIATTPHLGYAHRTIDVEIESQADGSAIVELPLTQAMYVEKGQTVFLYNDKAELLALPATVSKIGHTDKTAMGVVEIEISFSTLPELPLEKLIAAQIVIATFEDARRLPISSMQRDEKGHPFVWEAVRQQDGTYRAKQRMLERAIQADWDTLVYKNREHVSDIYIVNPDSTLRDGQVITVTEQAFKTPEFLKPSRIEAAYQKKLEQYKNKKEEQDFLERNPPTTACGTSCGSTSASQDFINRVRALAEQASISKDSSQP